MVLHSLKVKPNRPLITTLMGTKLLVSQSLSLYLAIETSRRAATCVGRGKPAASLKMLEPFEQPCSTWNGTAAKFDVSSTKLDWKCKICWIMMIMCLPHGCATFSNAMWSQQLVKSCDSSLLRKQNGWKENPNEDQPCVVSNVETCLSSPEKTSSLYSVNCPLCKLLQDSHSRHCSFCITIIHSFVHVGTHSACVKHGRPHRRDININPEDHTIAEPFHANFHCSFKPPVAQGRD